ncbi:MAG: type III PLP-dependent enzyme, partial [Hyphomonadaceae bacterium]
LAFMHPVKNRQAIARAYHFFGCRTFVLDTADELQKILDETLFAKDLTLVVRLAVTSEDAVISLSGKFGVGMAEAPGLLRQTRAVAARLGISFHGGSQCMMPGSWNGTMLATSMVIKDAGVPVDIIDVGGGFPSIYPGMTPRGLDAYINIIKRNHDGLPEMKNTELWCEPGRALVAESESLITRIEQVRPGALYINDGGFGALFDAVRESWRFPVRAIKAHGQISGEMQDWFVHGPTCDPVDALAHPIALPANLVEGDYIEFGNLGAYGSTMASRFNGFGRYDWIETHDAPWDSLYPASVDALGTGTA